MSTEAHLHGSHDPGLVVLSVVIAMLASYAALDLASRVAFLEGRNRRVWLVTSGIVMGTGIWSMHFIGMLAFTIAVPIGYDAGRVLLSLAVAVAASTTGFSIVTWLRVSRGRLIAGGALLGAAIAGMHYIGMWALLGATQHYRLPLVVASIAIAFVASTTALALFGRVLWAPSRHHRVFKPAAGLVMGAAIASMHYTGMAAVSFPAAAPRLPDGVILPGSGLAAAVTLGAILLAALALFVSASEYRLRQAAREPDAARRSILLVRAVGRTSTYAAVLGATMVVVAFASGLYRRSATDELQQTVRLADQHHAQLRLVETHIDGAVRAREPAAIRTVVWALDQASGTCDRAAIAADALPGEAHRRFSSVCTSTRALDSGVAVVLRAPPAIRARMIPALQADYAETVRRSDALGQWMDRRVANGARTNRLIDVAVLAILLAVLAGLTMLIRRSRDIATAQTQQLVQLASIVEASSDAIVGQALDGTIQTWNRGAEQLFGYAEAEIVGQHFTVLVPPEQHDAARLEMLAVVAARGGVEQREVERLRKDGTRIHLSLTEAPVRDTDGRVVRVAAVARDVTARRAAEEAQRRARDAADAANQAKSEFLANMSHEIRTPMNGILGMLDLALDTSLTPDQQDFVETARASAESLLGIVNDVLDFSRIEAGHLALDPVPFALEAGVLESIRPLGVRAREKGLSFTVEIAPAVPRHLVGDAGRLRQVLLNLVANAVKFTPAGSVSVRVNATAPEGDGVELHVSVEDTGVGVAPEKQQAIFETFQQADTSITREYGGTGLGLAISSRLVALLGGELWVESEPGSGSTFHFTARLVVDRSPAMRSRADAVHRRSVRRYAPITGTGRPLRVLIAEDHPVNLRLARAMLEGTGIEVSAVGDGASAVDATASGNFDLVLMDVQMPVMSGLDAARLIRQRERGTGEHLPLVAVTARAMGGDRAACLAAGMDDYLAKPVTADALFAAIARAGVAAPVDIADERPRPPGETAPPVAPEEVLDEAALLRAVEHDEELRAEVAGLFLTDADTRFAEMESALEDGDAAALQRAAHALAGGSGSICAPRLTATARELERLAGLGDLSAARRTMGGGAADLARLRARLTELVPSVAAR